MNEEAKRAFQKLKEQKELTEKQALASPAAKEAAMKDYNALSEKLKAAVTKTNQEDLVKETGVKVTIEGPWGQNYTNYYLLAVQGGKYPNGSAYLIGLQNVSQFDYIKLDVAVWQSHLTIRGLQENLSGYQPGKQPQRLREYSYKLAQIGTAYEWSKEGKSQQGTVTTDQMVQDIISALLIENLPTVK